jgi:hypothetical protein
MIIVMTLWFRIHFAKLKTRISGAVNKIIRLLVIERGCWGPQELLKNLE